MNIVIKVLISEFLYCTCKFYLNIFYYFAHNHSKQTILFKGPCMSAWSEHNDHQLNGINMHEATQTIDCELNWT